MHVCQDSPPSSQLVVGCDDKEAVVLAFIFCDMASSTMEGMEP